MGEGDATDSWPLPSVLSVKSVIMDHQTTVQVNMTRAIPPILLMVFVLSLSVFVADGCAGDSSSSQSESGNGGFCGTSTKAACSADTDCVVDGCWNQVCRGAEEPPIITICGGERTECYDADKYSKACGCVDNQCQWKDK